MNKWTFIERRFKNYNIVDLRKDTSDVSLENQIKIVDYFLPEYFDILVRDESIFTYDSIAEEFYGMNSVCNNLEILLKTIMIHEIGD